MKRGSDGGAFCRQICRAHVLLQRNGWRPACNVARFTAMYEHRVMIARNVFSEHLKTNEPALDSFLFLFQQRVAADEFSFFELHDPSEACFQQCCGSV